MCAETLSSLPLELKSWNNIYNGSWIKIFNVPHDWFWMVLTVCIQTVEQMFTGAWRHGSSLKCEVYICWSWRYFWEGWTRAWNGHLNLTGVLSVNSPYNKGVAWVPIWIRTEVRHQLWYTNSWLDKGSYCQIILARPLQKILYKNGIK